MPRSDHFYISQCLKAGIRIFPVPASRTEYILIVEYNSTEEFLPGGRQTIKRGKKRYPKNTKEWSDKIRSMYQEIYYRKINPQKAA